MVVRRVLEPETVDDAHRAPAGGRAERHRQASRRSGLRGGGQDGHRPEDRRLRPLLDDRPRGLLRGLRARLAPRARHPRVARLAARAEEPGRRRGGARLRARRGSGAALLGGRSRRRRAGPARGERHADGWLRARGLPAASRRPRSTARGRAGAHARPPRPLRRARPPSWPPAAASSSSCVGSGRVVAQSPSRARRLNPGTRVSSPWRREPGAAAVKLGPISWRSCPARPLSGDPATEVPCGDARLAPGGAGRALRGHPRPPRRRQPVRRGRARRRARWLSAPRSRRAPGIPWIRVKDAREALAALLCRRSR